MHVLQAGVLKPLLNFITGENRDVQRFAIMCLKELCENRENRSDLFEQTAAQPMLDAIFELVNNVDPRVRQMAGLTLVALLGESNNKLIMLDAGSLPRMLALLSSRDAQLRRFGVDCIVQITKLQDIHPLPLKHCHVVRADEVLALIVDAFGSETDTELLLGLLKSLQSLIGMVKNDAKRMKQRLYEFGLLMMLLEQARRLIGASPQTADTLELMAQIVRTLSSLTSRSKPRLESIYETGHDRTVVLLCRSADRKVRRGATRLLGRLSTLVMWKKGIATDSDVLPLLLSMCKVDDSTVQVTAAQILAEIAELPTNRLAIVEAGIIPPLLSLLRLDDSRVNRDAMRTIAALAEAVENRESMSYRALDLILSMLWQEDQEAQAAAVRALANLAAPAGVISENPESRLQAMAKSGRNDQKDSSTVQTLGPKLPTFKLVGRCGSSFVPPEDYENEPELQLQPDPSAQESLSVVEPLESEQPGQDSGKGRTELESDCEDESMNDSNSTCSSAPSAVSSSESIQPNVVDLALSAAEEARAGATSAVTAARNEQAQALSDDVCINNDPGWWSSEEGKELMYTFNYSTLERIHLKLVESAAFTDLFNPDLPYVCYGLQLNCHFPVPVSFVVNAANACLRGSCIRELSPAGVHAAADLIRFVGRSLKLSTDTDDATDRPVSMAASDEALDVVGSTLPPGAVTPRRSQELMPTSP